jgi:hypothetical protein
LLPDGGDHPNGSGCVQGGSQTPQQSDGGLGATFFDARDLIGGHLSPAGQFCDAEAQGAALVIDGFAEGQGLSTAPTP